MLRMQSSWSACPAFPLAILAAAFVAPAALGQLVPPNVLAVDGDRPGNGTGATWQTAYKYLRDALAAAAAEESGITAIWVRGCDPSGTLGPEAFVQYPDREASGIALGSRNATFDIPVGVVVYGGFAGSETERGQRDPEGCETTLSGNIVDPMLVADNSYTIVTISDDGQAGSVPDTGVHGLTIADGWADFGDASTLLGPDNYQRGVAAAMLFEESGFASRCIIRDNGARAAGVSVSATGISLIARTVQPEFHVCTIRDNQAFDDHPDGVALDLDNDGILETLKGGGVMAQTINLNGATTFSNCEIFDNHSNGHPGGVASQIQQGGVTFVNCTIVGNSTTDAGGAALARDGTVVQATSHDLQNTIVWNNLADGQSATFASQIVDAIGGISSYSHSIVTDIDVATYPSCFSADPEFVNEAGRDLRLACSSLAIDVADEFVLVEDTTDVDDDCLTGSEPECGEDEPDRGLNRRTRAWLGTAEDPDVGAYEYFCPKEKSDIDGSLGVGFDDLLLLLAAYGPCPVSGPCDEDIDGDGEVGFPDLIAILADWGWCCTDPGGNVPPQSVPDCIEKVGTSDPQKLAACIEAMMRVEAGQ